MMERHKNNNERYKNASIDLLRLILCPLKEDVGTNTDHDISCDIMDQCLIMFDLFPFQLFYNTNVEGIFKLLRVEYRECYEALEDLYKYISDSIVESLQRQQGQNNKNTPMFTLGSTLKKAINIPNGILHFLLQKFKATPGIMHPCLNLDKSHACTSEKRYINADTTITTVYSFICNKDIQSIFYGDFWKKNKNVMEAVCQHRKYLVEYPSLLPIESQGNFRCCICRGEFNDHPNVIGSQDNFICCSHEGEINGIRQKK